MSAQPPSHIPQPQQPPKKRKRWPWVLGSLLTLVVVIGGCSAAISGGDDTEPVAKSSSTKPSATETTEEPTASKPATTKPASKPKTQKPAAKKDVVVFKVWGKGNSDIMYGSDADSRSGNGSLPFKKSLKLDEEALYYQVTAQLQGGGDINCSVTVNGETKKGHASGGYNICSAQLNGGLFGW